MVKHLRNVTLLVFLLFNVCSVFALETFTGYYKQGNFLLNGKNFEVLKDTSHSYSLQDVIRPGMDSLFKHNPPGLAHGIDETKATYWMRFRINSSDPEENKWILEFPDLHIDHLELYQVEKDGNIISYPPVGYTYAFGKRAYPHKNFVYDILLDTVPKTFYVKVRSSRHNALIALLRSNKYFAYYSLNEYYLLGIFYGIMAIMAIYNLLLAFSFKEKNYLFYVIYVVVCVFTSFAEDGTGFQYLWPEHPAINDFLSTYSPIMLLLSFSIYSKNFLQLRYNLPRVNKFLNFTIIVSLLTFALNQLFWHRDWNFPFYVIPFTIIYLSAILCLKNGYYIARFFLLGYSFMFVGLVLLIIRMVGLSHNNNFVLVYSFNIGLVFEIVILSIALSDRIKNIRYEKEKALIENQEAQKKMIVQLQENQRLKDNLNKELEAQVAIRTQELKEANEELEDALEELKIKTEEIDRMNKLLASENEELQVNVKELTKARVLMQEVDFKEFSNIFPDKETCFKYLSELKWSKGYECKKCGNHKYSEDEELFSRRCTKCRYVESVTAYTIFHKLKFPITKAFYMLFLVYANKEKITDAELSQILTLRQKTCWKFHRKILDTMELRKKSGGNKEIDGWSNLVLDPDNE